MTDMKVVNLIIVFDAQQEHVLMCLRAKNPYKGLYNFVGGKKQENETDLESAYRELHEETGISREAITIKPLYTTRYHEDALELQVYYGILAKPVELVEEINPLVWIDVKENFTDDTRFAGQGNIKHMIDIIFQSRQREGL